MERISTTIAGACFAEEPVPWPRWAALVSVAIGGSLIYGASFALALPDWTALAGALWLCVSAGLAWCVLIPVLCWVGKVNFPPCFDACLVTMAFGEIVLVAGALVNLLRWWSGSVTHAALLNIVIVGISNVVMALVLAHRLRPHGVPARRVWTTWMLALNGSGAVFFLLLYQWLHRL